MSRIGIAGIFSLLLAFSIAIGAYSTLVLSPVVAFSDSDLRAPGEFTPAPVPSLPPNILGNSSIRPDISIRILIGQMFEVYGGSIQILITNNDTRSVFLNEVAFDWLSTNLSSYITVNARIEPQNSLTVSALAVEGPPAHGGVGYLIRLKVLQYQRNGWYRLVSAGDEWLSFGAQSIDVQELASGEENRVSANPRTYYLKTNELVDLSSEMVARFTDQIVAGMGDGYHMGKVCALFDWQVAELTYTEDPGGGDVWYSPDETLLSMAGDCEDYAMLLAAMVDHAGGTARMYLTQDHAFAAVFVGTTPEDLGNATADIRAHYRTGVEMHAFQDDTGYWMVADPLGTFYMGGLAVGQAPTVDSGDYWGTTFPETRTLYSVDITGQATELPLWLDPMLWLGAILVFGALALSFAISALLEKPKEKTFCHLCAGEVEDDLYVCPFCQTTYHRRCAFSQAYCQTCQKPVQFPPPPPPPPDNLSG